MERHLLFFLNILSLIGTCSNPILLANSSSSIQFQNGFTGLNDSNPLNIFQRKITEREKEREVCHCLKLKHKNYGDVSTINDLLFTITAKSIHQTNLSH